MWVLIYSTRFGRKMSHSKKKWARYDQNVILVHVKNPLLLSDSNETWIFSTDFGKKFEYQIL
jgi:hypothetical protein